MHLAEYKKKDYIIMIYKYSNCFTELPLKMASIEFGDCCDKLRQYYNIDSEVIMALEENNIIRYQNNPMNMNTFFLFKPKIGKN